MADDDEAFGDFTFAASTSASFSHHPQIIVSQDALTSNSKKDAEDEEEEDEWGDFVTPKSDSAADRSIWMDQKSGGFVGLATDRFVVDRVKEEEKGFMARGALPLSIFGEEEVEEVVKEEEEERRECGGGFGFGGGDVSRGKSGELGKKESNLSDLLASLYGQGGGGGESGNGNIADPKDNGLKKDFDLSNSNGYVNGISSSGGNNGKRMDLSDSSLGLDLMNSGSDGFSSSAKAFDQGRVIKLDNGRRTKSDEYVFNFLSLGADGFNFSGMLFNTAVPVKNDNGWSERKLELDFNSNAHELGNDVRNIGSNIEINGTKLGTKSSSSEDNDDDEGWEFQGNTDVSKEQDGGRQLEISGSNILKNGPKLNSYQSVSGPDELQVNSSKEDENQGKWEFMDFAAPSSRKDTSEMWNFNGNGTPAAKESDDGLWNFQGIALPTANDEHNSDLGFVDNCNTSVEEEEDGGWEFQVAPVDQNPKLGLNTRVQEFGAQGATLRSESDTQVAGAQLESSQKTNFVQKVDSGNDSLMGISPSPGHDFGFDSFVSSMILQNEAFIDSVSKDNRFETENQSTSATLNGSADADDSYWDFKDSFPENSRKNEVNKADGGQKGALPPSLFSDVPLDSSDSLNQDDFSFNPSQSLSNSFRNPDPSASFNDLILNLYNQSEKNYSKESPEQDVTSRSDASRAVNDSLSNDEDDFDGTWDFKDASLSSIAYDQRPYQPHESKYTISKMENLLDFYCKLKDQSSLAAICHLACLKEAKSNAEDAEVEALDDKIQDALEEFKKANIALVDAPENCKPENCLKEFHQVLSEPKFQMLESEYGLSRRLTAAEKDLKPAIELVEHAASILKLLSAGSAEQQQIYISTWTEILFVCAQELQHGASIWQRAVKKGIHSQILSQTKGKTFVRALGEVFRVVLILEASSKAYRPWILSNSTDGDSIFTLLSECSTLWSNSGLNGALEDLSNPTDSESAGEVQALLDSINDIRELDVPNVSLRHQDSVCGLSLLNGAMIPDVKMVVWNGKQFFLPLANLWANLISSDPPNLPRIVSV